MLSFSTHKLSNKWMVDDCRRASMKAEQPSLLCWVRRSEESSSETRINFKYLSLPGFLLWSGLAQYKTTWNENLLYISRALNGLWTCFHYRVLFAFRAFFSSLITSGTRSMFSSARSVGMSNVRDDWKYYIENEIPMTRHKKKCTTLIALAAAQ